MLKLKYLFENFDLAKEALKNWNHDEDTLDDMLSRFRISSNAIYPFKQEGSVCFLRLAPEEEKLEKNIRGELAFISYLRTHRYPALEPIQAANGETCLKLDTPWGSYYASAFRRVEGIPMEHTDLSKEIMYEYGKTLGKLHSLAAAYEPKTKKWSHDEVLDWIRTVLSEYNAPDAVVSELSAVQKELGQLPRNQENYGLIHYDFELDNVFYDSAAKTCSVIDFDDGMYHWYALDIVQVFDAIEEDREDLSSEALLEAEREFIRGYQEEHGYTEEMEASFPVMRRFVKLYGYARLIRCVAEKFESEPEWLVELRTRLNRKISEVEAILGEAEE